MRKHRDKDEIEQDLFAELARLRTRMQEIHEQGGCQDPDMVMAELESEAQHINGMMDRIIKEIGLATPGRSNLNSLADEAAKMLVASVSFPVVVHTCLDPQLPELMLSPEFLRPVVERAMRITAEHEGPGAALTVSSSTEDGKVVLDLTATNIATGLQSCMPIQMRSASLVQLVEEAGGQVQLQEEEGRVQLTIRLGHTVPTK